MIRFYDKHSLRYKSPTFWGYCQNCAKLYINVGICVCGHDNSDIWEVQVFLFDLLVASMSLTDYLEWKNNADA